MIAAIKFAMTDRVTFHKLVGRDQDLNAVYEIISNVKCLISSKQDNSTTANGVRDVNPATAVYFFNEHEISEGDIVEFGNGEKCEIDRISDVKKFGKVFAYFSVMRK